MTQVGDELEGFYLKILIACAQALGLGVWDSAGGRGWGEGKE